MSDAVQTRDLWTFRRDIGSRASKTPEYPTGSDRIADSVPSKGQTHGCEEPVQRPDTDDVQPTISPRLGRSQIGEPRAFPVGFTT